MILRTDLYSLDADIEATKQYAQNLNLCDCCWDRNFYVQATEKFPKLTNFLANFGLSIDRPDEISPITVENEVHYLFIGYTVVGKVLEKEQYELDLFDGGQSLNIVIGGWDVPNEQKSDHYFTIKVFNIKLPWVLDEPNPEEEPSSVKEVSKQSTFSKIKSFFSRS